MRLRRSNKGATSKTPTPGRQKASRMTGYSTGTPVRRSFMPPPTSTFTDAFTGGLQNLRRRYGELALLCLVLCFAGFTLYLFAFFADIYATARVRAMDRPLLIERRPVTLHDLDLYSLHMMYQQRFGHPVRISLTKHRGRVMLQVTDKEGHLLERRSLVPMDLNRERILARHEEKTGDIADVVDLYYREGIPMLVVKSSDFDF